MATGDPIVVRSNNILEIRERNGDCSFLWNLVVWLERRLVMAKARLDRGVSYLEVVGFASSKINLRASGNRSAHADSWCLAPFAMVS